ILQWDDARMNVPAAWATTLGDRTIKVAVLDTGVQKSHRELKDNIAGKAETFVPCEALRHEVGEKALKDAGLTDCGKEDKEGHGTWVASRIAGSLNGFASNGTDGIATTPPGRDSADFDLRGLLETPAGVPGVVMVSATNNANGAAPADDPFGLGMHVGARDQLAYYSSYGSRVDLAAPGGARRFNLPGRDGGDGNILYGGWGSLGALAENGVICRDPLQSSLFNFACFKVDGAGFGWLQGTSMSAPNALGVAALAISAKPALRHDPADLVDRLQATARRTMTNYTG